MNRPINFKLHFNRINMQRGLPQVWTVHTYKQCIPAITVNVNVPLQAVYKGPKHPQPRAFMVGRGRITIERNGIVSINR